MRLRTKMCLWLTIVLCVALSVSGCLCIAKAFSYSMKREQKQAVNQYHFIKFLVQSNMIAGGSDWKHNNEFLAEILNSGIDMSLNHVAIFNKVKEEINSTFPGDYTYDIAGDLPNNMLRVDVKQYADKYYLELCGVLKENDDTMYLLCASDISSVFTDKKHLETSFYFSYLILFVSGSILVFVLSSIMIHPINKLNNSAQRIAQGNFSERVEVVAKDEIGELSRNFNRMAEEIENQMKELKLSVLQKENFVANFAHELKTPLTSVIGYSDMIYHKDLSKEQVKEAAEYIMNEGLRLEALSLKLMELLVLNRQDFIMEYLNVQELFQNIKETVEPQANKKKCKIVLDMTFVYVKVEYDLLKTLVLNLLDNAMKANATEITVRGRVEEERYKVYIEDNGIGIQKEELNHIMEAFYVVDKSRSRKQHGVGLGLALAEKIAQIHGTNIAIASELGQGTTVSFSLLMDSENEVMYQNENKEQ